MANSIDIKLPYTKNEVLKLTLDSDCYATMLKQNEYANKLRTAILDAERSISNFQRSSSGTEPAAQIYELTRILAEGINGVACEYLKAIHKAVQETYENANLIIRKRESGQTADKNIVTYKEIEAALRKAREDLVNFIKCSDEYCNNYGNNHTKTVLILGGGISGLMTAWILLDKGYKVSIVAKEWATQDENKEERITSQIAGALWEYPPGGCGLSEIEVPILAYSKLKKYREWAMQSFVFYERIAKVPVTDTRGEFGARTVPLYQFFHHGPKDLGRMKKTDAYEGDPEKAKQNAKSHHEKYNALTKLDNDPDLGLKDKLEVKAWTWAPRGQTIAPQSQTAAPQSQTTASQDQGTAPQDQATGSMDQVKGLLAEINCDAHKLKWAYQHQAPVINTDKAMKFLMDLVSDKGAVLETRDIEGDLHLQERELMDDFQADIIVNATGLGARTLANDDKVFPVRGAVKRLIIPSIPSATNGAVGKLNENISTADEKQLDKQLLAGGSKDGKKSDEKRSDEKQLNEQSLAEESEDGKKSDKQLLTGGSEDGGKSAEQLPAGGSKDGKKSDEKQSDEQSLAGGSEDGGKSAKQSPTGGSKDGKKSDEKQSDEQSLTGGSEDGKKSDEESPAGGSEDGSAVDDGSSSSTDNCDPASSRTSEGLVQDPQQYRFLNENAVLLPAQYDAAYQPSKTIFIVPREEATDKKPGILIVGSIIQRNNKRLDNLTKESPEFQAMWNRAKGFATSLSKMEDHERPFAKGLRPFSHSNVRVAADGRTNSCRVVHNYGHGGSGWTLAVGCAWTCVKIVEKMLHEKMSGSVANAEVWECNC